MNPALPPHRGHTGYVPQTSRTRTRPHRPQATRRGADVAHLAARLTRRDVWLLAMLHEHQVLTSHQVSTLAYGSHRSANRRLALLHQLHVVDSFRPLVARGSAPEHYTLGRAGAAVLAAHRGIEPKALGWRAENLTRIAFSPQLGHTVRRNGLMVDLAAPTSPSTLTVWLSERSTAHLWGDHVRPDAYGHLTDNGRLVPFFLEYDTGSESLARVEAKLTGYATLAAATSTRPAVLIHTSGARREAALRTRLAPAADQYSLPVATSCHDLHPRASCAGPVWLPATARPADRTTLARLADAFVHALSPAFPGEGQETVLRAVPPRPPAEDDPV